LYNTLLTEISPATNSRFKQLRVLWEVHFRVPQNFLSLTEINQFRISQLREAANVSGYFTKSRLKLEIINNYEKLI
jgi:5-formaminoimidazole-4-carboxamide-1-beta-D-ribofuranosyl 5'-monophosphate synthetase